ncbi:hypothetical protein [Bartonella sp. AP7XZML]|uniref:hypothetical protein n=1 Tax=Bartonella sp. AP7XZML TaxID=3243503 RepID=UPI0035CF94EE
MIKKKYKLTDETIKVDRITLYRIRALKDFGDVKKGDLGGFVESERNLSHDDNCWVGDEAWVYEMHMSMKTPRFMKMPKSIITQKLVVMP